MLAHAGRRPRTRQKVPFRTRLRRSLPIRRLQIGLGLLYRTLKHTHKPKVRAPVGCKSGYVLNLAR